MPETGHVLTWRQRKVLRAIRESVDRRGYPPTLREICKAVGLSSTDSVRYQLEQLQEAGYLTRDDGKPRSIRLTGQSGEGAFGYSPDALAGRTVTVPNVYADESWPLPAQVVGEGALFALDVNDDSMRGAAILAGDLVVASWAVDVWDGLVVALVDGTAVVREIDGDWLMPRHPDFVPRHISQGVSILGRVVAVIRQT